MTAPECGYPAGSFWARFVGPCAADCGGQIIPGDAVMYVDGALIHATCRKPVDPDVPGRNERRCPDCWTWHAGDCL